MGSWRSPASWTGTGALDRVEGVGWQFQSSQARHGHATSKLGSLYDSNKHEGKIEHDRAAIDGVRHVTRSCWSLASGHPGGFRDGHLYGAFLGHFIWHVSTACMSRHWLTFQNDALPGPQTPWDTVIYSRDLNTTENVVR